MSDKPAHTVRFEKVTIIKELPTSAEKTKGALRYSLFINARIDGRQCSFTLPAYNPATTIENLRATLEVVGVEGWHAQREKWQYLEVPGDDELPF